MQIIAPATANSAALDLRRLFILRSVAIGCEIAALVVAVRTLHMALPLLPIILAIAFHVGLNVATWFRLKQARLVPASEFSLQIVLDTLVLAVLLYFSGGYTNPFVSLFLLPLVISASLLPQRFTRLIAALTIGCYTVLMFYYVPLPHMHSTHGSDFDLHVLGMWFSFLLSAGLVVFFVVRMSRSLRERDEALARAREKALHDEHLVALGTLATGAAHELGTPLATMAVLANELKHEYENDPEIIEKVEIIRQQLDRCKAIISDISASAGQARAEGGGQFAIDEYLQEVCAQWQAMRPQAKATIQLDGSRPAPHIVADKTLTQAIINILNNAADASIDQVEIEGRWTEAQLTLDIRDRGEGIPEFMQNAAGAPYFTTKADGHGLGLYLARAVIDRYHGSLTLTNRSDGGTQARVILPLTSLEI